MGNIDFLIRESSIAKWLERRPLKPGVMSSIPGLYIFRIRDYFFISLSFFFFSQFRSKTLWEFILKVRIYIESTTIPDLQWKRSQAFFFSKLLIPHMHKGTIKHIAWLHLSNCKLSIQDTMLLSR